MHRPQFVVGESFTPVNMLSGVPQGPVLGPILFLLLYINGGTGVVTKDCDLCMFADDNLLFSSVKLGIWATILTCRKTLILYMTGLDSGLRTSISLSASS